MIAAAGALPVGGKVANNGTLRITANTVAGPIDGSGTTVVSAGSNLTANHIVQSALVIGGTATSAATVTIWRVRESSTSLW